jgi:hypothetical protein
MPDALAGRYTPGSEARGAVDTFNGARRPSVPRFRDANVRGEPVEQRLVRRPAVRRQSTFGSCVRCYLK